MLRERFLTTLVGATIVLAACGGGTAPTSGPGQTSVSQTTTGETTSNDTNTATTSAATTGAGSADGDACALLTTGEITEITGHTNIVAQPVPDADTDAISACGFVSEGVLPVVIVTILDPANTNTDPAGYLALPGSEEVQVSGARAVWVPAAGNVLFLIKGGTVVTLLATSTTGEAKDAPTRLAQKVADRL